MVEPRLAPTAPAAVSVTIRAIRRRQSKVDGASTILRFFKDLELPSVPVRDQIINPGDGTPEMVAWTTRLRARGPTPPAVSPVPWVEVGMKTEDGAGVEALLAAGWVALPVEAQETA